METRDKQFPLNSVIAAQLWRNQHSTVCGESQGSKAEEEGNKKITGRGSILLLPIKSAPGKQYAISEARVIFRDSEQHRTTIYFFILIIWPTSFITGIFRGPENSSKE